MDLVDHLTHLYQRVQRIEGRVAGKARHGTVQEVDTAKQLVRLRIGGTDAEPYLSPWIPYAQVAGPGQALKIHAPPAVGQSMTLLSPSGDLRQSTALPLTWSTPAPSPGQTADPVATYGQVRFDLTPTGLKITAGPMIVDITTSGIIVELGGKGFRIDAAALQMTHVFKAKDPIGQPAHYVTGLDTDGDQAVDGNPNVIL